MNEFQIHLPLWVSIPASLLLVIAGVVTLVGSLGLLRLRSFFDRIHSPTMGNTIGTGSVLIASMLTATTIAGRPVVHELLITLFIVMASPITAMLLMRAAIHRDKARAAEERERAERSQADDASPPTSAG